MLHDMPVGLVPGTAGLVPGLVVVSSSPDSVAIRRFSSRPHHLFNMADVDCIRTVAAVSSPAVATVSSPVVAAPPYSVANTPPDSVALAPPDSVATATASLVPTISSTFSTFAMSVAKLRSARQTKMADVDLNIQDRQVTLKNHCT